MKNNRIVMPHGFTMLARGITQIEGVLADIAPGINLSLIHISIAQVHRATLKTGEQVVVKVQKMCIRDRFNDADVLQDKGKVTAAIAKEFAEREFEKYRVIQDSLYESDFDKLMNRCV